MCVQGFRTPADLAQSLIGSALQDPDLITMTKYKDVDLDQDPVVVLPCQHLLTMHSLDGHMELHKAYALTASGEQPSCLHV